MAGWNGILEFSFEDTVQVVLLISQYLLGMCNSFISLLLCFLRNLYICIAITSTPSTEVRSPVEILAGAEGHKTVGVCQCREDTDSNDAGLVSIAEESNKEHREGDVEGTELYRVPVGGYEEG